MRFAVTAGDSREAFFRRYSTLLFMLPFKWPFCPLVVEAKPFGSLDRGRRDLVPIEFSESCSSSESEARRCWVSSGIFAEVAGGNLL
jgi:hypothetical protein